MNSIVALGPQKVAEQEAKILGNYSNTYTFSKSMAERVLAKKCGNLSVTILRPSIIVSAYKDPFPGWIDTLAAAGGLVMAMSLGGMHFQNGDGSIYLDFVPVDFVCSQLLVHTVVAGRSKVPKFQVVHSATSDCNPLEYGPSC